MHDLNLSPEEIYLFVMNEDMKTQIETRLQEFEQKYGGVKLNG